MKMNDVKQKSRREKYKTHTVPYNKTVYRKTQYNLYVLEKYVKTYTNS